MQDILFFGFLCLFAVYGLLSAVTAIIEGIKRKPARSSENVRVAIIVKNADENIEDIIRNVIKYDFPGKAMSSCNLAVVDLGSGDDTAKILERLGRDYQSLDVYRPEEKEKVFCGLS